MPFKLDEVSSSPNPPSFSVYSSDAHLAVVAGSDTTATVLSNIFFYMLMDKSYFEKWVNPYQNVLTILTTWPFRFARLRQEIDDYFPLLEGKSPSDDTSKLPGMPYLNAIM